MAGTAFTQADPRTILKWSKKLFIDMLNDMTLTNLLGSTNDSAIVVDSDLTRGKGTQVTMEMYKKLEETGGGDDDRIDGNEERLFVLNMPVQIHERSKGVVSEGQMSAKRTSTKVRRDGRRAIRGWGAEKLEFDLVQAISGLYNESGISTVNEAEPTTNRIWYGGQTVGGAVTSVADDGAIADATNYLFGTKVINRMAEFMDEYQFGMVEVRNVNKRDQRGFGRLIGKYWVCVAHPRQIAALRNETGEHGWTTIVKDAHDRGAMNPIFSGAVGVFNGVIIYRSNMVAVRTGAGGTTPAEGFLLNAGRTATTDELTSGVTVARALFLGAQAGMLAWGQTPSWYEYWSDIDGRIPGIASDMIYGAKKTIFNDHGQTSSTEEDYAVLCADTAITPLA